MASDNIYKSTIMFTDIVGYSAIVDKNQSHAMELLSMHDKIIEPIIKENNGRIIKKIGDAIFAEYSNAPESIQAAQKTQVELAKRNIVCNPKDQIVIRIGLHIGNVIRKDDDLFGPNEFLIRAQRKGYKIKEFPVRWTENYRRVGLRTIFSKYFIPVTKLWISLTFKKNQ